MINLSLCILLVAGFAAQAVSETRIQSLHIDSKIRARFASTVISSKILNVNNASKEVVFHVVLPNAAFISNYTMLIDGKLVVGEVKEKAKARQAYDDAKSRGQTTGLVAQAPRETNQFRISVNVEANAKVTFTLNYQEILRRVQGVYKHQININPDKLVEDMKIRVSIVEKPKITVLKVPKVAAKVGEKTNKNLLRDTEQSDVSIVRTSADGVNTALIEWSPTRSQQKEFAKTGAQMVVLYDVERTADGGEIETVNGFFVHHFAPEGLPVGNKHVVFVLDRSGSMQGTKVKQMKDAMELILDDLNEKDKLSIVTFSDEASVWKPRPITATKDNIRNAKRHVSAIVASGGTNIHEAMERGIAFMNLNADDDEILTSMVVFLTDGQATSGKTSDDDILGGVNKWNKENKYSVHCISFGNGADFGLLKKIASQNKGLARKVYEDSDAQLQLAGFYDEISSPLLSQLDIEYLNETVKANSLVKDSSYVYSKGSEVVTIGKVNPAKFSKDYKSVDFEGQVKGVAVGGEKTFRSSVVIPCWDVCHYRPLIGCPRPLASVNGTTRHRRCIIRPPPCHFRCPHPPVKPEYNPLPASSLGGFVERMWAYLTIKRLLEDSKYSSSGKAKQDELKKKALDMSIKYNFVTELTSMVVVKPNEDGPSILEEEKTKSSKRGGGGGRYRGGHPRPASFSRRMGMSGHSGFGGRGGFGGPRGQPGPGLSRPQPAPASRITSSTKLSSLDLTDQAGEIAVQPKKLNFTTASDANFDINWETVSKVARSREQCSRLCIADSRCKFALFTPPMRNCLLSYDLSSDFVCGEAEETVPDDKPVVLYCNRYE